MKNSKYNHVVVFDGTSAYVISIEDLQGELENGCEVLGKFMTIEEAFKYSDCQNNLISGKSK